ncbi:CASP-like protein 1E2 isoform X2 [Rhododendron vialii]|uniref:CASP-like protein 1E2 isoform X2 n=1 Tax=Rhododendron vialii TaxID=182163 RepID=UPI00265FADD8|nr:CASP-like protein 1E2 isoform X2 [Rhododendron vialii]
MMDTQNGNHGEVMKEVGKRKVSMSEVGLRFLAFSLTLVAAVLVGVDKQTKIVAIPLTAKFHYFSAFVYFVVVNAIACAYAIISLVLTLASNKGGNKGCLALMITTLDLVMLALLSSASGATGGIGLIGIRGNSHVQWKKVCNVFDKFCHQLLAGFVLSVLGSAIFLLLLVISARKLQKKHY